ncbi:polysaccharide deacetylase family protein [Nocardioides sp. Kera G14]|uniref:polysaccharide deacetylase family protein n=1 Tax=Nocardioides sp. Kera G14 TaxID=2884264 RepID=UPI001D12728B|nr:polysaccharide deacetylase family protein [Nocardioides sp. Kera G14]UDY24922.1 polysaccharide deacetylase family protein [Nocardioides sp. Kera G14]
MIRRRASRWAAEHLRHDWLPLRSGRPILSITFDDVIASACVNGAAVLAKHGVKATWYVAGGLTDRAEAGKPTHSLDQLRALHADGHELACHGWSHQRCTALSSDELESELVRSRDLLSTVVGHPVDGPLDFAYPLGDQGLRTRAVIARQRRSQRVTGGGMHRGRADLGRLGSFRLYGRTDTRIEWEPFLRELAATDGGWGIVNTHGVDGDPGLYGTTPENLDAMVGLALELGCQVLPVGVAIGELSGRRA